MNPNADGKMRTFIKGHNARMDTERRAAQININRENSKDKIDAIQQTDLYKEHMSISKKNEWAKRKQETPEKAEEIMNKLYEGRAKIVYDEERCQKMSETSIKYIENNREEFMKARKKAGDTKRGKPRSPETREKMTKILQSPERREIVSKTHKGKPKSEEMKQKLRAHFDDPEYKSSLLSRQAAGNGKKEPSMPELLFFDLFQQYDIPLEYVGYSGCDVGGFIPDFINKEKKVIVECYGYYHYSKQTVKERDQRRRTAYSKAGYTLLEFWSYNIHNERRHEHERLDEFVIVDKVRKALDGSR
jgi:hypothetical protein